MNIIKNISKIHGLISEVDLAKLEIAATLHLKHSNITFKILEVYNNEIHVRTEQGRSLSENYATKQVLIDRTRELFGNFLPGRTVYTHPVTYTPPIVEVVTPEWIQDKLLKKGVKIKDLVTDTGIPKNSFSNWINGNKPMSQIVKSMFYFYLTR